MNIKAKWRVAGLFKADAQKVYEEIGDNEISAEELLDRARDKNTELHKCFEWDNDKAAEKYRLQQARQVLNSLVFIPVETSEQPVRIYSYTPETKYKPTIQMVVNLDEYANLLKQAKHELDAFKIKYKTLKELKGVFDAIEEL